MKSLILVAMLVFGLSTTVEAQFRTPVRNTIARFQHNQPVRQVMRNVGSRAVCVMQHARPVRRLVNGAAMVVQNRPRLFHYGMCQRQMMSSNCGCNGGCGNGCGCGCNQTMQRVQTQVCAKCDCGCKECKGCDCCKCKGKCCKNCKCK